MVMTTLTIFLRSDARLLFILLLGLVQLLFEGGVYFFYKPGDINRTAGKGTYECDGDEC